MRIQDTWLLGVFMLTWACQGPYGTRVTNRQEQARKDSISAFLVAEMQDILRQDQYYRVQIRSRGLNGSARRDLMEKQRQYDLDNQARLERIFENVGYPDETLVGDTLALVGVMVVHHSNRDYMRKHRDLLMQAAKTGRCNRRMVAAYLDRLHGLETGTYLFFGGSGYPQDTTTNIDSMRRLIGLSTRGR